jgi:hypothetical protein
MFSFSSIEPDRIGRISKWDLPMNEYLGIKFDIGRNDTVDRAVNNWTEDQIYSDDTLMKPDVANQVYGIPDYLKFDEPISVQQARLRNERKRGELYRMAMLESAAHANFAPKAFVGFAAQMVGGLASVPDLALTLIPFVGSEKVAAGVAKQGIVGAFRQRLARGVITEESLIAKGLKYPKLTVPMIDASVNQAAIEIPIAIQKARDDAEYGLADSAINIIGGGLFAGGLKMLGHALSLGARTWNRADARIKAAEVNAESEAILNGTPRSPGKFIEIDEKAIRERVYSNGGFDEVAARRKAEAEFGKTVSDIQSERRSGKDHQRKYGQGGCRQG